MATAKNAARNLLCFFCFTVIHSFRLTVFDPLAWSDLPPRQLLLCVYSIAYHPHYGGAGPGGGGGGGGGGGVGVGGGGGGGGFFFFFF